MSLSRLQQLVVELHHDPARAARVHADPATLAGEDLDPDEIRWLRAVDPRAWSVDRYRADRVLTGLLQEHPVATGLLVSAGRLPRLRDFCASRGFTSVVRGRGTLAEGFAQHLEAVLAEEPALREDGLLRSMCALEAAMAQARRRGPLEGARAAPPQGGRLELGAGVAVVSVNVGALPAWTALRRALPAGGEVQAVLAGKVRAPIEGLGPDREWVLIQGEGAGEIGEDLGLLLDALPIDTEGFLARAREMGAAPGEDVELLQSLMGDGVVRRTA